MSGTVKFNLFFALFGFLFTFLFSLTANVWQTSIIRGTIGFFAFFLVAYIFRGIWGLIATEQGKGTGKSEQEDKTDREVAHSSRDDEPTEGAATAEETSKMIRSLLNEDEDNPMTTND